MTSDTSGENKRKKQWKGAQDGGGKRHKGAIAAASTAKGFGGVLVTCDKTKERQSVKDALNILNEVADKYFPATTTETNEQTEAKDNETTDSIQKKLQEEINALKKDAKNRQTGRFSPLDTGVKGVLLIQFLDTALSPVAIVSQIFEEVEATKVFASRFINRMIPLEKITYSSVEDLCEAAKPMIEAQKQASSSKLVYAVEVKRRNCSNINSMDVVNALAALVGPEHKVNLSAPETVVLVEIFRNTCGVSVVTNFHQYKKYNVRSILDPPVSTKPKATSEETTTEQEPKEEE